MPRRLSARYGTRTGDVKQYPTESLGALWQARALSLNIYLLDNTNPDSTVCRYKTESSKFPEQDFTQMQHRSKEDLIRDVINDAVNDVLCIAGSTQSTHRFVLAGER